MDTGVFKVADFRGCLDAAMALKAVRGNMHMDTIALVDAGIMGPLHSCYSMDGSDMIGGNLFLIFCMRIAGGPKTDRRSNFEA